MALVKICGINTQDAIDAAIEAGADWIGLNFFPPSPRYVTPVQARDLSARHPGGPPRVGLFVNPDEAAIAEVLAVVRLDILQLYADPGQVSVFRRRFGLPVWRSAGVVGQKDLPEDMGGADALVIEAKPPADATRPGGNATRFDWTITKNWRPAGPWLLAGGLDPGNVAAAIRQSGAAAVDVSSGVERAKGVKDASRIKAFIANARSG